MTRRTFTVTIDLTPSFGTLEDIPSDWTVDDEDPPLFVSAQLGNLELDEAQMLQVVGYDEWQRCLKSVADWWAEEGWAQALADERANEADYANEWREEE